MELLKEFEYHLKHAINTAHTGTMSTEHSVTLLADAGGVGVGAVRFVSAHLHDGGMLEFQFGFDMGKHTVGTYVANNDSVLIVTADAGKKYLVSPRHRPGDAVSVRDARVLTHSANCPVLVHIGNGNYKVLTPGTFQCSTYGSKQHRITNWGKGQYIGLGYMDSCHTDCVGVGPEQYNVEHRELGSLPAVHPSLLRHTVAATAQIIESHTAALHEGEKMQREFQALIEDTRTQIDMMSIEQQAEKERDTEDKSSWWTFILIGFLATLLASGAGVWGAVRLCRKKGRHETADRDAAMSSTNRTVSQMPLPIMEMRILPPEGVHRAASRRLDRHG
jgi:hypothetical protein